MPRIDIDAAEITDFERFHEVFAGAFGFPDFYGRNMDAWIDCMTYLDDPSAAMTQVHGTADDPVVVNINNVATMPEDVFAALNECAAFVNWRRIEGGGSAILALSYYRSTCVHRLGKAGLRQ